jgi:kynureninase
MTSLGEAMGLEGVSPSDPAERGSHISFRHPYAYALCQALIARGVIGDFRDPDILRFGLTPLYLGFEDIVRAGAILADILNSGVYRDPVFSKRHAVT